MSLCPKCGNNALELFTSIECSNPACELYAELPSTGPGVTANPESFGKAPKGVYGVYGVYGVEAPRPSYGVFADTVKSIKCEIAFPPALVGLTRQRFVGEQYRFPVANSFPGRSATFAVAQALARAPAPRWVIDKRSKCHSALEITGQLACVVSDRLSSILQSFAKRSAHDHGMAILDSFLGVGDYADGVGIDKWVPAKAPTPRDTLWGIDRSVDPRRLAGIRVDASARSFDDDIITAASRIAREGGSPDTAITYGDHAPRLVTTVAGPVTVHFYKPEKRFDTFVFDSSSWSLLTVGSTLRGRRASVPTDAYEVMRTTYWQFACVNPGHSARILKKAPAKNFFAPGREGGYFNLVGGKPGHNAKPSGLAAWLPKSTPW